MSKIIFFGGCTGVGKTQLFKEALKKFDENDYFTIKISDYYIKEFRTDKMDVTETKTIAWYKDDWKKYETEVVKELKKIINENSNKTIIINKHFATISPYGYLPGINMESLCELLSSHLDNLTANKTQKNKKEKTVGILLVDTDPDAIRSYYENPPKTNNNNENSNKDSDRTAILGYLSNNEAILKDLEENRNWAGVYCAMSVSMLGIQRVLAKTIYIDKAKSENTSNTIKEIVDFFSVFMNKKEVE